MDGRSHICMVISMKSSNYELNFPCSVQASAFVYGVHEVLVDLGPGSGLINSLAVMSSDAVILPLNIDHKSRSTIASVANKLATWASVYEQSITFQENAWSIKPADRLTPLPRQTPKFLGATFNRSGYNQNHPLTQVTSIL